MKKEYEGQLPGKKVLIATVPADGHFNPLTGIAKYLQHKGCDVRWYTSSLFSEKLKQLEIPHYDFVEAMNINPKNLDELFPERKLITDVGEKANFDMINCVAGLAPGTFNDVLNIKKVFDYDVVITDSMFPSIPLLKAKLAEPVISIGVFPLPEESSDLGPYGLGLYPPENDEQQAQYAGMKKMFNDVVFKEAIKVYSDILNNYGIETKKAPIFDTLVKQADLYLQIGSPSFEYKRSDLSANIRFIGSPLPFRKQNGIKNWSDNRLKEYQHIVLVSQGTAEFDMEKLIIPTIEAFKETDVLVITCTGGSQTAELREKYNSDNVIIEDYIPFDDVMPFASVFVTNGGYGGTLLAIEHQLPLVAAGVHEGKAEICSRIGYFNCGINLQTETPTSENVKLAVEAVLSTQSYRENISKLSVELKSYNSFELISGYIDEAVEKKRS